MNTNSNLINANIDNLTSLWKAASTPFQTYFQTSDFDYCTSTSDWPNRLWFHHDPSLIEVEKAIKVLTAFPTKLAIPYWDIYDSNTYEYLEIRGLKVRSEQIGMSLQLNQRFELLDKLSIKRVTDDATIQQWTVLYPEAFGYKISPKILQNTYEFVDYYLAFFENRPIGTAIVHYTDSVAGIHGVGIVPEMRKQGFAEEIMKFVLNEAIDSHATHATLQASVMGKGLYLKLGFEEQFSMKNYALQP